MVPLTYRFPLASLCILLVLAVPGVGAPNVPPGTYDEASGAALIDVLGDAVDAGDRPQEAPGAFDLGAAVPPASPASPPAPPGPRRGEAGGSVEAKLRRFSRKAAQALASGGRGALPLDGMRQELHLLREELHADVLLRSRRGGGRRAGGQAKNGSWDSKVQVMEEQLQDLEDMLQALAAQEAKSAHRLVTVSHAELQAEIDRLKKAVARMEGAGHEHDVLPPSEEGGVGGGAAAGIEGQGPPPAHGGGGGGAGATAAAEGEGEQPSRVPGGWAAAGPEGRRGGGGAAEAEEVRGQPPSQPAATPPPAGGSDGEGVAAAGAAAAAAAGAGGLGSASGEGEGGAGEQAPGRGGDLDVDTAMPYGNLEPFGREDTARDLTQASIQETDAMVDQLERAEVAEEKRAIFRALTRLRGAAITSFDGVARSQTGNLDEYSRTNKWRKAHPVRHLAEEESDVARWAFPDAGGDF